MTRTQGRCTHSGTPRCGPPEVRIDGRSLVKGDVVKIARESGLFAHLHGEVVDSICVFGGPEGRKKWRHFTPDRVSKKLRQSTLVAKGLL
jgi:hypothetical protein